jgi:hypothetical protein
VNDVVKLLNDRGIIPVAVEGINGDDGEQRCGGKLEPMVEDPLHVFRVSFARVPGAPCSRRTFPGFAFANMILRLTGVSSQRNLIAIAAVGNPNRIARLASSRSLRKRGNVPLAVA